MGWPARGLRGSFCFCCGRLLCDLKCFTSAKCSEATELTTNKQTNRQPDGMMASDGMTEGDSRPEARAPWGWGPQRAGPEPERIQSQRQIIKLGCLAPVALVRRFRPWPKTHPPTSQCPHPSSFRRYIRISWPLAPGCCILQHSTNEMSGWSGRVLII